MPARLRPEGSRNMDCPFCGKKHKVDGSFVILECVGPEVRVPVGVYKNRPIEGDLRSIAEGFQFALEQERERMRDLRRVREYNQQQDIRLKRSQVAATEGK